MNMINLLNVNINKCTEEELNHYIKVLYDVYGFILHLYPSCDGYVIYDGLNDDSIYGVLRKKYTSAKAPLLLKRIAIKHYLQYLNEKYNSSEHNAS